MHGHEHNYDAAQLIMCKDGKYKSMVYEHLLNEGTVQESVTKPCWDQIRQHACRVRLKLIFCP